LTALPPVTYAPARHSQVRHEILLLQRLLKTPTPLLQSSATVSAHSDSQLTLGHMREQLEHLTPTTCPLPFLLRPPFLLFLVTVSTNGQPTCTGVYDALLFCHWRCVLSPLTQRKTSNLVTRRAVPPLHASSPSFSFTPIPSFSTQCTFPGCHPVIPIPLMRDSDSRSIDPPRPSLLPPLLLFPCSNPVTLCLSRLYSSGTHFCG
jgi:hypothetical protein